MHKEGSKMSDDSVCPKVKNQRLNENWTDEFAFILSPKNLKPTVSFRASTGSWSLRMEPQGIEVKICKVK